MSSHNHATAATLAGYANNHTAPSFGDLGAWAVWNADTLAATAAVHVAERALAPRTRKPNRRHGVPALIALGFAGYLAARKAAKS